MEGVDALTESAETRLARIETLLGELAKGVDRLSEDFRSFGDRLTRLESATSEAVPYVWRLRERVAELERDTANLRLELGRMRQDYDSQRKTSGSRWWDVAKLAMSPLAAAVVAWLIATKGR